MLLIDKATPQRSMSKASCIMHSLQRQTDRQTGRPPPRAHISSLRVWLTNELPSHHRRLQTTAAAATIITTLCYSTLCMTVPCRIGGPDHPSARLRIVVGYRQGSRISYTLCLIGRSLSLPYLLRSWSVPPPRHLHPSSAIRHPPSAYQPSTSIHHYPAIPASTHQLLRSHLWSVSI